MAHNTLPSFAPFSPAATDQDFLRTFEQSSTTPYPFIASHNFSFGTQTPAPPRRSPATFDVYQDATVNTAWSTHTGTTPKRSKRRQSILEHPLSPTRPQPTSKRPKTSHKVKSKTDMQKLDSVLHCVLEKNWTLGELMYHVFRLLDDEGKPVKRSGRHGQMAANFLSGRDTNYGVGQILSFWMRDKAGLVEPDGPRLYSTSMHYDTIKTAKPALTTFGAHIVWLRLYHEADNAVHPSAGLHAMVKVQKDGKESMGWADVGKAWETVEGALVKHQPLAMWLCESIAKRKPRVRGGVVAAEKMHRPPRYVSSFVLQRDNSDVVLRR